MSRKLCLAAGVFLPIVVVGVIAYAGPVNPDISVVGQPFMSITNDPASPDRKRLRLDVGETEFVFDAYLNPYARGTFIAALSAEGFELEEGYFNIFRSLPLGLGLKGGKYRVGFGRLNPVHPHALPFAERFFVMSYLPGDEAFNETGGSLSERIPIQGDFSINLAGDYLQGDSFRIERTASGDPNDPLNSGGDDQTGESRPAFVGRLSGFTMLGEQSALEFGVTGTGGTNNVAARTETRVYGADVKAKLWTSPRAYLVLQAEALKLDREEAAWDSVAGGFSSTRVKPMGGYVFADYNFGIRYNIGASYERFQEPTPDKAWDQSIGAFAGYSLLEETTAFRADWRRFMPDQGDDVDTFTLRVIYSMGPHKAHQF